MIEKQAIDWERIEADYRAGLLSVREIASAHGITHGAINKRAKRDGWDRDLSAKIKAKAELLVSRQAVSSEVSKERADTEKKIVDANAQAIVQIRLAHRKDISRGRTLVMSLLAELEAETADPELFEQLGEFMRQDDDKGQDKRNELYRKIISSAGRIDSVKKLSDSMKNLIAMEREAWGLATQGDTGSKEMGVVVIPAKKGE